MFNPTGPDFVGLSHMRPLSDRLWRMGANAGQWRWPTRERLLPRRWGCFAGSSECRDEATCETRISDAFYTFHRSTRLCAVAVFVGLDMFRDEMRTTSPAEWWTWPYLVGYQTTRTPQEDVEATLEGRHDGNVYPSHPSARHRDGLT